MSTYIKYQDFTSYVCDYFVEKDNFTYNIKTYQKAQQKKFNIDSQNIRDIDIHPPQLQGKNDYGIKRLNPKKVITDSSKHNNMSLNQGYYCSDIKRVITLDSLSSHLKIYKLNCKLDRIIEVDSSAIKEKEVVIISFVWNPRQQRIGATLKDYSLAFWDWSDRFTFQKAFSVSLYVNEYQNKIWYLETIDCWITTDKSNKLYAWDLEKEELMWQLKVPPNPVNEKQKDMSRDIIEICELSDIKLTAIASLDKQVSIWNLHKKMFVFRIELLQAGVHHMLFNRDYNLLITCGYENNISMFTIDPEYQDKQDKKNANTLVGHMTMVTSIQCIQNSPVLVSCDDSGCIKLWDIRNFKCIQSMHLGSKLSITQILDISESGLMCFLGSRLNFIEFDKTDSDSPLNDLYPIEVEFNKIKGEIVVCTRKDLRFIDSNTGKLLKIYTGLLNDNDDEIAVFKSINQFKLFILGDQRGSMRLYSYQTGEIIKELQRHSSEISNLKIDFTNHLIISSSWDSSILIQKERRVDSEKKRELLNCHYKKPVSILEVSLYHNIILTASNADNNIYIYDYEFFKLLGCISVDQGTEITALSFFNGFSILCITTNNGYIYFVHINITEFETHYKFLSYIDLEQSNRKKYYDEMNRKIEQEKLEKIEKTQQQSMNSPTQHGQSTNLSLQKNLSKNAANKLQQNVSFQEQKLKTDHSSSQQNNNQQQNAQIPKYQPKYWPNKLITEVEFDNSEKQVQFCKLLIAFTSGYIHIYDLKNYLNELKIPLQENAVNRLNYNPFRQIKEDFFSIGPKVENEAFYIEDHFHEAQSLDISQTKVREFKCHKDSLTTFQYVEIGEKNLITASHDKFIRIWSESGKCLANVNCNHPLPIQWNLEGQKHKKIKKKIFYALKILDITKEKYKHDMVFRKIINVSEYISQLSQSEEENKRNSKKLSIIIENDKEKDIKVMGDEFSPRDLRYKEVKYIYEKEIRGASLKQMDATKRLLQAQMQWKQPKNDEKIQLADVMPKKRFTVEQDVREQLNYLNPNYYEKVLKRPLEVDLKGKLIKLNKQLDNSIIYENKEKDQKKQQQQMNIVINQNQNIQGETLKSPVKKTNRPQKSKKNMHTVSTKRNQDIQPVFSQDIMDKINSLEFASQGLQGQLNSSIGYMETSNQQQQQQQQQQQKQQQSNNISHNTSQMSQYRSIDFFDYANQRNLMESGMFDQSNYTMSMNQEMSILTSGNQQYVEKLRMHQIMKNLDRKLQLSKHFLHTNTNNQTQNQNNSYSQFINDSIMKTNQSGLGYQHEQQFSLKINDPLKNQYRVKNKSTTRLNSKKSLYSINYNTNSMEDIDFDNINNKNNNYSTLQEHNQDKSFKLPQINYKSKLENNLNKVNSQQQQQDQSVFQDNNISIIQQQSEFPSIIKN